MKAGKLMVTLRWRKLILKVGHCSYYTQTHTHTYLSSYSSHNLTLAFRVHRPSRRRPVVNLVYCTSTITTWSKTLALSHQKTMTFTLPRSLHPMTVYLVTYKSSPPQGQWGYPGGCHTELGHTTICKSDRIRWLSNEIMSSIDFWHWCPTSYNCVTHEYNLFHPNCWHIIMITLLCK